ncbi:hypothetical protein LG314_11030 [Agrococcus terreus]|uniref:hypothetical protein n=1 Tax=Agrococcus terreus TaxID=574649 RepID=UPI00384AF0C7
MNDYLCGLDAERRQHDIGPTTPCRTAGGMTEPGLLPTVDRALVEGVLVPPA